MKLTLTDFVLVVLLGTFGFVFILSILSRILHSREESRALAQRVICRLCLHAFEELSHVKTVHCPLCDAVNEKTSSRRLG